ncbi:Extradiol ring-cleavage dioxygenase, class III enzyme, subunit B [Lipomyces oligophaga]|uniref:Extradiol ring-cleavage dioxygenase, class III enzyme, subunit B n=1 Tax=Lipomyces oligophaga TaxID=45792 RepID=UPI0034CED90F
MSTSSSTSAIKPPNTFSNQTPVYFFSHGGPTFMYTEQDPQIFGGEPGAFKMLRKIGKEIIDTVKPKAVVVLSAHWQATRDTIEVNTAEITPLIYDFYGFPSYMYEETYPNVGSKYYGEKVLAALQASGIKARAVNRGLDHGVWVPFKIAFPDSKPLTVPIIQTSLFASDDPNQHIALGRALAPLRDEGILIICSGMTVHNLREMGYHGVRPYAKKFDNMLESAINLSGQHRQQELAKLITTAEARNSHPTKEHLLPIYIAAGAAYDEPGKLLYTTQTSSLAWGEYRFGSVKKE